MVFGIQSFKNSAQLFHINVVKVYTFTLGCIFCIIVIISESKFVQNQASQIHIERFAFLFLYRRFTRIEVVYDKIEIRRLIFEIL